MWQVSCTLDADHCASRPSDKLDGCSKCPADYDFDSPNAFDHEELVKCMQDLQVPSPAFMHATRICRTSQDQCAAAPNSAARLRDRMLSCWQLEL
jgi:hypothetical protein